MGLFIGKVKIPNIKVGGLRKILNLKPLKVTANGTYSPSADIDGFSSVTVNVPTGGGDGVCKLKPLTVTPSEEAQIFSPEIGYDGYDDITVEKIPDSYRNTNGIIVNPNKVLNGIEYVDSEGSKVGSMPTLGALDSVLDANNTDKNFGEGYTTGGNIGVVLESKTVKPSKLAQKISSTNGKLISEVLVDPIPDQYQDVSQITANSDMVLEGISFINKDGEQVGTMPNNRSINMVIDGVNKLSADIPAGYTPGGTVVFDETAIARAMSEV